MQILMIHVLHFVIFLPLIIVIFYLVFICKMLSFRNLIIILQGSKYVRNGNVAYGNQKIYLWICRIDLDGLLWRECCNYLGLNCHLFMGCRNAFPPFLPSTMTYSFSCYPGISLFGSYMHLDQQSHLSSLSEICQLLTQRIETQLVCYCQNYLELNMILDQVSHL